MDIEKLRLFLHIADLRSMAAAARGSYLSQGALSQYIQSLENELGCTLFSRRGRYGLSLTSAGEELYKHAQEMLRVHRSLKQALSDLQLGVTGEARLGCMFYAHIYVLPDLMSQYLICHPQSSLALRVGTIAEVTDLLDRREIDLGLVWSPIDQARFDVDVLCTDHLVFTASARHFPLPRREMQLAELASYPFIFNNATSPHATRRIVERVMQDQGVQLGQVVDVGIIAAVREHVLRGTGLAVLPESIIRKELAEGDLLRIPVAGVNLKRDVLIIRSKNCPISPASERLHDFLKLNGGRILGETRRRSAPAADG